MQISLWSRENLEKLVKDLREENARLHRINFGRVIAVVFFTFWAVMVWSYLSHAGNSQSCNCSHKVCGVSK